MIGVTVLLDVRAVNRLFRCPKVLIGDHLRLWSIRCRFWSLCLARTLTRSFFTCSRALDEKEAGDDWHPHEGGAGSS